MVATWVIKKPKETTMGIKGLEMVLPPSELIPFIFYIEVSQDTLFGY